jgi:hypothetical protein
MCPLSAAQEYIRTHITKAWELRAGMGNPNTYRRLDEMIGEMIVIKNQCVAEVARRRMQTE